ncbi:hypothetical protein [Tepidiforma sp.]|uniref:hypothetical protein n=1 Tax=Tepidiforma sp. TaxID=2682230 RepID=UPI002ADE9467|nr:hypothetical protein [Tepidiforma sp.]
MVTNLPGHVVDERRDGKKTVLLHRSMAVIGDDRIEIKSARSTIVLPLLGLLVSLAVGWLMVDRGPALPFWLLVAFLLLLIVLVPVSVMALVGALVGADVVVDARKGSATWQQGYLGMGIGTKELVPFAKIDHLEICIEGDQPDRWHDLPDDLRQFSLVLVKASGRRLTICNVPVPAYGQEDGMDRTLAVGQAIAQLTGARLELPAGWELVEIDVETGKPVANSAGRRAGQRGKRHGKRR